MGCGGVQDVIAITLMSAFFVGFFLDALSAIYTAYNRACMRLDNESWLRTNCKDPVFFSNMRAHTNICSDVEANARVGAFWAALREVSDDSKAYLQSFAAPVVVGIVVAAIFIPLCCLCVQRFSITHKRRLRCLPMHNSGVCLKNV